MNRYRTIFKTYIYAVLILTAVFTVALNAQSQTVGLFENDTASFQGYTLFNPLGSYTTYLIDNYGRSIHTWESNYKPRLMVYLLEDGSLLRTSKITEGSEVYGGIEKIGWDGTVEWDFAYYGENYTQHHDIELLPNGNVLILASESIPADSAIAVGRDPTLLTSATLISEYIVEIHPTGPSSGTVVWEWHVWDHLVQEYDPGKPNYGVVAEHPELINLNYIFIPTYDWLHGNTVDYNPDLDQIIICLRNFNEFWIIDHGTTSAEAAGHSGGNRGLGGDIIYRWGNPQAYNSGTDEDHILYFQHDAQWIPPGYPGEGNILIFNNGLNQPGDEYSSIVEVTTTADSGGNYPLPDSGIAHGPAEPLWTYVSDHPGDFYSANISGVQRLPNGNTLICSGRQDRFFEITSNGEIVWEYINPIINGVTFNQGDPVPGIIDGIFRCLRYGPDFAGLAGRDLTPGSQLELYDITFSGLMHNPAAPTSADSIIFTATITSSNPLVAARSIPKRRQWF